MIRLFRYFTRFKVIRFLISGGMAATITIGTVYLLTEVYSVFYLIATTAASLLAITFNFFMQKFWTFRERTLHRAHTQTVVFLVVNGINLVLNGAIVAFFVEIVGLRPVLGQICAGALIAVESFFAYSFIFRARAVPGEDEAVNAMSRKDSV